MSANVAAAMMATSNKGGIAVRFTQADCSAQVQEFDEPTQQPFARTYASSSKDRAGRQKCLFFVFGGNLRFDVHVAEFAGVEYLAAFQTFHELRVLVTRDDLDTRVKTDIWHRAALREVAGRCCRWDEVHIDVRPVADSV